MNPSNVELETFEPLATGQVWVEYIKEQILKNLMWWLDMVRKEGLRRGYSIKTIKTYIQCLQQFFKYDQKDIKEITKYDVRNYLYKLQDKGKTGSTLNVHLSALKFLYSEVLNKRLLVNIKYSKIPKRIPRSLTKDEIKSLLGQITNSKHKLMISLLYSAGLRISELLNLRVEDLNIKESYGWVRQGKGNKDRQFIIADSLRCDLGQFIRDKDGFIFTNIESRPLTSSTVREILKTAAKKAKLSPVHPHSLRHSFATHLIENGYSVMEVQPLLGHSRLETTMIYTHLATPTLTRVKSPFDAL